jgi:hypothetical protein
VYKVNCTTNYKNGITLSVYSTHRKTFNTQVYKVIKKKRLLLSYIPNITTQKRASFFGNDDAIFLVNFLRAFICMSKKNIHEKNPCFNMSSFLTTCYELIKVEEGPGLHVNIKLTCPRQSYSIQYNNR